MQVPSSGSLFERLRKHSSFGGIVTSEKLARECDRNP